MIWLLLAAGWLVCAVLALAFVAGAAALNEDEKSLEKVVQRWSRRVE